MMAPLSFIHIPVLQRPVLELAAVGKPGLIVDCTVGGAGHTRALLEAFPEATLLGLDRDPHAVNTARERLVPYGKRARVIQARFSELPEVLGELKLPPPQVVFADFGVSSHQLDTPSRGFSFRSQGALDMRMNPDEGESAAEVLKTIDEARLLAAIRTLGEERYARRVARAIVAQRPSTTEALATLVRQVVPKSKDGIDPATRTFQAVRMLVNEELDEVEAWLKALPNVLADHGVGMAISFHSLEDRAVKVALRRQVKGCICPPNIPMCACGLLPTLKLLTPKARQADAAELAHNVRARSARLRAAQRLARPT